MRKILQRGAQKRPAPATVSKIGGGNFANGAISAAFVHVFNHLSHSTWDKKTEETLATLDPRAERAARAAVNELDSEHGIQVRVYAGFRSDEDQNTMYALGRDKNGKVTDKLLVRTNAKGGESYHNVALAVDVVEIAAGKAIWNSPNESTIVKVFKAHGFEWGGDWKGNLVDRPHFQMTLGMTVRQHRAPKPTAWPWD